MNFEGKTPYSPFLKLSVGVCFPFILLTIFHFLILRGAHSGNTGQWGVQTPGAWDQPDGCPWHSLFLSNESVFMTKGFPVNVASVSLTFLSSRVASPAFLGLLPLSLPFLKVWPFCPQITQIYEERRCYSGTFASALFMSCGIENNMEIANEVLINYLHLFY